MIFKVKTDKFVNLLKFVNPITSKKEDDINSFINLSVFKNKLTIQITDYHTHTKGSIDVVDSKGECDIILPFNVLYKLIRSYEKDIIKLKYKNRKLFIKDDSFNYNIPTNNIDFPNILETSQGIKLKFPEKDLADIFDRLKKIIPKNPDNPALGGMNIDIKKMT